MKILRYLFVVTLNSVAFSADEPVISPIVDPSTEPAAVAKFHSDLTQRLEETLAKFDQTFSSSIKLERVKVPSADHLMVPAYIFTPAKIAPDQKYPGLVFIRGGAHGMFGENLFNLVKEAIARGYILILPDIRGSTGYGLEYYKTQDLAGGEIDDVLESTEFLLKHAPQVDSRRLAVMGISHGGMMVLYATEKAPQRFQVAVDVVGPTSLVAYAARRPTALQKAELYGQASLAGSDRNPQILVDKAPIAHVADIRTPLLILATSKDTIVPAQLHQTPLIAALNAAGVAYEYKFYREAPEGHAFFLSDTEVGHESMTRAFDFIDRAIRNAPVTSTVSR